MRPIGPEEALLALQDRQLQQAQLTHQYKCRCQQRVCTERRTPRHRSQAVKAGRSDRFKQEQSAVSRSLRARPAALSDIPTAIASQRHRTAPPAEIQRRNLLDYIHASPIGSNQSGSRSIGTGSQGTRQGSKRICTHTAEVPAPAAQHCTYRHIGNTIAAPLSSTERILKVH